jgi:hypothetical protein
MGKDLGAVRSVPFRRTHKVNYVKRDASSAAPRLAIEQTTCPPKAKVTRSNRVGRRTPSVAQLLQQLQNLTLPGPHFLHMLINSLEFVSQGFDHCRM